MSTPPLPLGVQETRLDSDSDPSMFKRTHYLRFRALVCCCKAALPLCRRVYASRRAWRLNGHEHLEDYRV